MRELAGARRVAAMASFLLPITIIAAATLSAASPPPCTARFAAHNLSGLRLVGGDSEYSKNTTQSACIAACCAEPTCTAWNYHVSSANPRHNVRSCWLSTAAEPEVTLASRDSTDDDDVWDGGSRRAVKDCTQSGCSSHPPGPEWPAGATPRPTSCDGSNYTRCRSELWKYVFNTTTGELVSQNWPQNGL